MQITDRYLNTFKLTFANNEELFAVVPTEVPLSGFEKPGNPCISTDIPPEDDRASQLDLVYKDTNADDALYHELVSEEAKAKRQTFVIPRRDQNDADTVGYLFQGLLAPTDARLWYRAKFGYEAPTAPSPEPAPVDNVE